MHSHKRQQTDPAQIEATPTSARTRSSRTWPSSHTDPGARQMMAVTASSAGFVAVGSHGNQPSAWAAIR